MARSDMASKWHGKTSIACIHPPLCTNMTIMPTGMDHGPVRPVRVDHRPKNVAIVPLSAGSCMANHAEAARSDLISHHTPPDTVPTSANVPRVLPTT